MIIDQIFLIFLKNTIESRKSLKVLSSSVKLKI